MDMFDKQSFEAFNEEVLVLLEAKGWYVNYEYQVASGGIEVPYDGAELYIDLEFNSEDDGIDIVYELKLPFELCDRDTNFLGSLADGTAPHMSIFSDNSGEIELAYIMVSDNHVGGKDDPHGVAEDIAKTIALTLVTVLSCIYCIYFLHENQKNGGGASVQIGGLSLNLLSKFCLCHLPEGEDVEEPHFHS